MNLTWPARASHFGDSFVFIWPPSWRKRAGSDVIKIPLTRGGRRITLAEIVRPSVRILLRRERRKTRAGLLTFYFQRKSWEDLRKRGLVSRAAPPRVVLGADFQKRVLFWRHPPEASNYFCVSGASTNKPALSEANSVIRRSSSSCGANCYIVHIVLLGELSRGYRSGLAGGEAPKGEPD